MAIEDEEETLGTLGTKKGIKILPIGTGQGGSKLTQTIGIKNVCKSSCVYINTSTSVTFFLTQNNDYGNSKNHTRGCSAMDISFLFKYTSFIQFYFVYLY